MDLYHLNDIFCHLAHPLESSRLAVGRYRPLLGIQCTLTVCWSSLAACSASALLPLGGFGLLAANLSPNAAPLTVVPG